MAAGTIVHQGGERTQGGWVRSRGCNVRCLWETRTGGRRRPGYWKVWRKQCQGGCICEHNALASGGTVPSQGSGKQAPGRLLGGGCTGRLRTELGRGRKDLNQAPETLLGGGGDADSQVVVRTRTGVGTENKIGRGSDNQTTDGQDKGRNLGETGDSWTVGAY